MGIFSRFVGKKIYRACPKTYEKDMEKIEDNTAQVFTFNPDVEDLDMPKESIADTKHRSLGIPSSLGYGLLGTFVGSFMWMLVVFNIPGFRELGDGGGLRSVLCALVMFFPTLIFMGVSIKGIIEMVKCRFALYIDKTNYYKYEFRKLANGKFVIIEGQNFAGDNPIMASKSRPELNIPFKAIYEITRFGKRVEEEDGLIIRASFNHKILDMFAPESASKYFWRPYNYLDIYIERGLYSSDFPEAIGVKNKTKLESVDSGSIFPSEVDPIIESDVLSKNKKYNTNLTYEDMVEITKCKSYKYNRDVIQPGLVVLLSCVVGYVFFMAVVAIAAMDAAEQGFAIFLLIVGLIAYLWINISSRQVGTMQRLIQYFRDSDGTFYRVQFLKGASATMGDKQALVKKDLKKAQDKVWAYYYVKRFKQGIKDYNFMTGGEAKVTVYPKLTYKRSRGIKKSVYTYEEEGRKKKVVIPNMYEGLLYDASKER